MMKTNKIIQRITKTIKKHNLISSGDRVLIGLSGGADSVFLLHVLHELSKTLGFGIGACHVEHGIRGIDAVKDMEFSKALCAEMGIDCYACSFDVPSVAKNKKLSLEAAGRLVRYDYFKKIMQEEGYNLLATAHHRDDKVETIVMNMLRGCGLKGFVGIEYKNGDIIRPLIDITKSQILHWCEDNKISYCTDETNSQTEYTRNKIRHKLLPELREFNPSFDEAIIRQSSIIEDEDAYLKNIADEALKACMDGDGLSCKKLSSYHKAIQRRVIYSFLASVKGTSRDITYDDVDSVLSICALGETGKSCNLSGGVTVSISYGILSVCEEAESVPFEYSLRFNEPLEITEAGIKITLYADGGNLLACDSDSICVRSRRNGDYFCPLGMNGTKKLKDYFQEKKIQRTQRDLIPVVEINGEIAEIIGMRKDRRFYNCGGTCRIETELL